MNIDLNRGVTIRYHPSGMAVYMYKAEPGVFYNAFAVEVTAKVAAQAGFNTNTLLKERQKRDRIAHAHAAIEREFAGAHESREVLERAGYKVFHVGLGNHDLVDPEGNKLNPVPLPEEATMRLLDALCPPEAEVVDEPEEPEPAPADGPVDPEPEKAVIVGPAPKAKPGPVSITKS